MVDPKALSRELVRALRGGRSQRALSRRLQYTTNVVYLWESGRRWPTGATFLWLAHRVGLDVADALAPFAPEGGLPGAPGSVEVVAAWMRHLQGRLPATELARRLGVSRHRVGRWLRGESEPRLPDLLAFIDVTTTRLLDVVARFTDPAALPCAQAYWARLQAARALTRERPWAPAVLLALELADYQALPAHDDAWIARRLGLPTDTVRACLALLSEAGQVRPRGGVFERVEVQSVDTRSATHPSDLKRWWGQLGLARLGGDGVTSFTVCAVSQADFEAMQESQRAHYRALRARIAASAPGERLVLVHLQTVGLDTVEPSGAS